MNKADSIILRNSLVLLVIVFLTFGVAMQKIGWWRAKESLNPSKPSWYSSPDMVRAKNLAEVETTQILEKLAKFRTQAYPSVQYLPESTEKPIYVPNQLPPDQMNSAFLEIASLEEYFLSPYLLYQRNATSNKVLFGQSSIMMSANYLLSDFKWFALRENFDEAERVLDQVNSVATKLIDSSMPDAVGNGLAIKELAQHCLAQLIQYDIEDEILADFVEGQLPKISQVNEVKFDDLIEYEIEDYRRSYHIIGGDTKKLKPDYFHEVAMKVKSLYNTVSQRDPEALLYVEERMDFQFEPGGRRRILESHDFCKMIAILHLRGDLIQEGLSILAKRRQSGYWPEKYEPNGKFVSITYRTENGDAHLSVPFVRKRTMEAWMSYTTLTLPDTINQADPISITLFDESWEELKRRNGFISPLHTGTEPVKPDVNSKT